MDYAKILSEFIAIDTSVPPGNNYRQAMEYLAPYFRQVGFETQLVDMTPENAGGHTGRVNLVCHRHAENKKRLVFYGHADVVPASGWEAFHPKVEDGRLYGRGAADMKGGLVGLLVGLEAVKDASLKYDVSVVVTTDEEVNQADQLRYLARFLEPLAGAYVFSLDSSSGFVSIAGLGALQMDILVKGKSVHSGLSHLGNNAVERSVPLLQALLALKSEVQGRESKIGASPDTGLVKMQARLNINKLEGGLKANIVPDRCTITIDRRLIPEENMIDAEREIMDCIASVDGLDWEISNTIRIPAVAPCDDPIVDGLSDVILKVTGKTGKFGEMGSGDLSRVVEDDWKGKSFGLGVIRTECNIHGNDEFVYLSDVEDLGRIVAKFLV